MGGGSAQDQVFQALLFCINYAQYLTGIHFFFFKRDYKYLYSD